MFVGFAYLSLYLAGKLQCFSQEGKSQSWRLIAVLTPLVSATVVGLSRIQDNMHHWEGNSLYKTEVYELSLFSIFILYITSNQEFHLIILDVAVGGFLGKSIS